MGARPDDRLAPRQPIGGQVDEAADEQRNQDQVGAGGGGGYGLEWNRNPSKKGERAPPQQRPAPTPVRLYPETTQPVGTAPPGPAPIPVICPVEDHVYDHWVGELRM